MVEAARAKISELGLGDRVEVRPMALEALHNAASPPPILGSGGRVSGLRRPPGEMLRSSEALFDGVLSNFGGLNCVADLAGLRDGLAACVRPRATVLLCIMGPLCPWEWVWYLGKGQPRKAFRRLRRGGASWRGLTIRYPSARAAGRAFQPQFRVRRVAGIGALVPPSYAEQWARRHERLVLRLDRVERRFETHPLLAALSDHYLLEMERL
jgi:hypothetical protein